MRNSIHDMEECVRAEGSVREREEGGFGMDALLSGSPVVLGLGRLGAICAQRLKSPPFPLSPS